MKPKLHLLACFAWLLPALSFGSPETPDRASTSSKKDDRKRDTLVQRVQRFYDNLDDFRAEFVQIYTRVALSRTIEHSGNLAVKKDGRVRFAYKKPVEKLFVADGESLWFYEPEEGQVTVLPARSSGRQFEAIAFLLGKGSLEDSFEVTLATEDAHPFGPDAAVLALVPKKAQTYVRLLLRVDGRTGQVTESLIEETAGNTNHFRFSKAKVNAGLPEALFQFVPPEGVEVVRAGPG